MTLSARRARRSAANDGIAVAMALAVLDAKDLAHPRLECLFTIDEETGMDGAVGFDASILQGKRLLNIDSEEEGILTVSCAGGAHAAVRIPMTANECALDSAEIRISGLKGGHSGAEIDKGRANATITLGRVLQALVDKLEVRLVSAEGGLKDNASERRARRHRTGRRKASPRAGNLRRAARYVPQGIRRCRPRRHRHLHTGHRRFSGADAARHEEGLLLPGALPQRASSR